MAEALSEKLGNRLVEGICICPKGAHLELPDQWRVFHGGHPLPNQASLDAATACFDLLARADSEQANIIFAISGGGSAMLESPVSDDISLTDLQLANKVLVSCGASISEINALRRLFSSLKGGKLLARVRQANAVTLIVSDTNDGDEASVASGPTIVPRDCETNVQTLLDKYGLASKLPTSIVNAINRPPSSETARSVPYYVVANNQTALNAAKTKAESLGYQAIILGDINEQAIEEGCEQLLSRLSRVRGRVCLISGGEFSCPVRGDGIGGRNSETVLRCAIALNAMRRVVVLSGGTDGIDGSSPAAGAIADSTTIQRASALRLNAKVFLTNSDSYTFFEKLNDTIMTGPTGTNVRDIRLVLTDD